MIKIRLNSSAVASAAATTTSTTLPLELIVVLAGMLGSGSGGCTKSHQVEHAVYLALISQRWPTNADAVRSDTRTEMSSSGCRMSYAGSVLSHVWIAVTCRCACWNGDGRRR